ncbi:UDP-glucoronosyl and UDP-glucosyl transferase [Oesophagostomum dentatum]|uniref:UDP-glucuronosyltransferase n=1 Tax=Oesophagostomum dentatum TaxID=61180 RepID=A0A0B1TK59_OESDE|nr:UDP-glucoronosyl and UDP-glucosyl transferase [Oesophagostomum dentatum]
MDRDQPDKTGVKLTKNIIEVPADPRVEELLETKAEIFGKAWVMKPNIYSTIQACLKENLHLLNISRKAHFFRFPKTQRKLLRINARVISNSSLLKQLQEKRFDVGIAEPMSICGFGIFKLLNIPATIASISTVHMDLISDIIGEPTLPSHVPGGMTTVGDRMNILERAQNAIAGFLGKTFFQKLLDSEIQVFEEHFGAKFVSSREWDAILNERNTTVLVSFGSIAKAIYMPDQYRSSLLGVFESMPNTTFIMKYEEENSKLASHLPNVHLSRWFPQNALLADPRLTAFITHGGLGSTTELAYQGKPAILIPILGDQPRNALMLTRHGGCIVLTKYDLETPARLREALQRILSDTRYILY